MVIDVIDVHHVAVRKAKDHPSIGPNRHSPKTPKFALERVQPEPRQVHIRNRTGSIETHQNVSQLRRVLSNHAARIVVLVKPPQSFVANRPYHRLM